MGSSYIRLNRRRFLTDAGLAMGSMAGLPSGARVFASKPSPAASLRLTLLGDPVAQGKTIWDSAPLGYRVEEYLVSGEAPIYASVAPVDAGLHVSAQLVGPGSANPQGYPAAEHPPARKALSNGPYTTRITVCRPEDSKRFSGTTIVETIHPDHGGFVALWGVVNKFFAHRGDALVAIQHPHSFEETQRASESRYGSLKAADPTQIFGMIAQVGALLKDRGPRNPLGVPSRYLYLTGYSFTASIVTIFAQYHHDTWPLASGHSIFDGYLPFSTGSYIRSLDVPVVRFNTESDFFGISGSGRLPDSDAAGSRRRRYEVAGACHAPLPGPEPGGAIPPLHEGEATVDSCKAQFPVVAVAGGMPIRPVMEMVFAAMSQWVEKDIAPPRTPWIDDVKGVAKKDGNGNALGGYRLPEISVARAMYGVGEARCRNSGYKVPFTQAKLKEMYGTNENYLKLYDAAVDELVKASLMLSGSADGMKSRIRLTPILQS